MLKIATKEDFDNLIEKIKNLVLEYENNVLHYNQYQFYLANSEKLPFEILPQAVPHLLGIRLDYLRSTDLFKNQDAYLLLKEFLENSYSVYRGVQEGHLSYSSIFSNYIETKLEAFEKVIYYFAPTDIEFICKYDRSRTFQLGLETNYPCDYFIAKKGKGGELYLLGLVRQGNQYMPMSSLLFEKDENQFSKLKGLLTNQILTFSNTIFLNNPVTIFAHRSYLPLSTKLDKSKILQKYSQTIKGISPSFSSDYQYMANGYLLKESKISTYKMMCQQLMQSIKEHEVFVLEQLDSTLTEQLDNEMVQLIETYNDEACKSSNSKAQTTYSDLLKEYQNLASQVLSLTQQVKLLEQESIENQEKIQMLEQENSEYQEFQDGIFDLVRSRNKKIELE